MPNGFVASSALFFEIFNDPIHTYLVMRPRRRLSAGYRYS